MMNKSSSRLIAWLLAMVMILNIFPVSALADTSDPVDNPPYGNTSDITVTYITSTATWKYGVSNERKGNEKTPGQGDFNYNPDLAGWRAELMGPWLGAGMGEQTETHTLSHTHTLAAFFMYILAFL